MLFRSPDVILIEAGVEYLRTLALSYVFFSFSNCYMMSLRAIENVKLSTYIYGISFFVNVFFNYCFIFGKLGFAEYGVQGAAMGTVIARFSEFIMIMLYIVFKEKVIKFKFKDLFKVNTYLLPDYMKYSIPVVGNELVWGIGSIVFSIIIGHLGTQYVAANSITDLFSQLTSVALFGAANAAAVITGKTIGRGSKVDAQRTANSILVLAALASIISCTALLLMRNYAIMFFGDITPETQDIAYQFLTVLAYLQLPMAMSHVTIVGILRGGGDTNTAFLIDCGCMWLIAIPLGSLAAFYFNFPPTLVYVLLKSDQILKSVMGVIRTLSGKWIRDITEKIT